MELVYVDLIQKIRDKGLPIDSRLGPTREWIGAQVQFQAGHMVWRPGFSKALGFMELIQLIGGVYSPEKIKTVAPKAQMELFSTTSAYGPRIYSAITSFEYPFKSSLDFEDLVLSPLSEAEQYDSSYFNRICRELRDNPDTRRAVLFIGKSWDTPEELSCTLTVQFLRRAGKVHSVVTMRSWDVIRGLPYDIMMFGGLLQVVAHTIKVAPGEVIVNAGSLHLYEFDTHLIPEINRTSSFSFDLDKCAILNGIKMMCRNAVYDNSWYLTESKCPYFISMEDWSDDLIGER